MELWQQRPSKAAFELGLLVRREGGQSGGTGALAPITLTTLAPIAAIALIDERRQWVKALLLLVGKLEDGLVLAKYLSKPEPQRRIVVLKKGIKLPPRALRPVTHIADSENLKKDIHRIRN